MADTTIHSFVLRFVQEHEPQPPGALWYGVIRHVQSSNEIRFADIHEALAFMEGYVDLTQSGMIHQTRME